MLGNKHEQNSNETIIRCQRVLNKKYFRKTFVRLQKLATYEKISNLSMQIGKKKTEELTNRLYSAELFKYLSVGVNCEQLHEVNLVNLLCQ